MSRRKFCNSFCVLALINVCLLAQSTVCAQSDPANFSVVINIPGDALPADLEPSTQINVFENGTLPFFFELGGHDPALGQTELNIFDGGNARSDFLASSGTTVNVLLGGTIEERFHATPDTRVTVNGGHIERGAFTDGELDLIDGYIESLNVGQSGNVTVQGGTIDFLSDSDGGTTTISGGRVRGLQQFFNSGVVRLVGGDFRLNGEPFSEDTIPEHSLFEENVYTGVLADGSSFAFGGTADRIRGVELVDQEIPLVDLTPIDVFFATDVAPTSLRAGQSLSVFNSNAVQNNFVSVGADVFIADGTVGPGAKLYDSRLTVAPNGEIFNDLLAIGSEVNVAGGRLNRFKAAVGSTVSVTGGTVGPTELIAGSRLILSNGLVGQFGRLEINDSTVEMSGGSVVGSGGSSDWFNTRFDLSGGQVFANVDARFGSVVNISGGTMGRNFDVFDSTVNLSGGIVDTGFTCHSGSVVRWSGGTFTDEFRFFSGSALKISGSDFLLDGVPINLGPGESFRIEDRDVLLSGILASGEAFSVPLSTQISTGQPFFNADANVILMFASDVLLGDINQDTVVDFSDIAPFIEILTSSTFLEEADCDQDGVVTFFDISRFIEILTCD